MYKILTRLRQRDKIDFSIYAKMDKQKLFLVALFVGLIIPLAAAIDSEPGCLFGDCDSACYICYWKNKEYTPKEAANLNSQFFDWGTFYVYAKNISLAKNIRNERDACRLFTHLVTDKQVPASQIGLFINEKFNSNLKLYCRHSNGQRQTAFHCCMMLYGNSIFGGHETYKRPVLPKDQTCASLTKRMLVDMKQQALKSQTKVVPPPRACPDDSSEDLSDAELASLKKLYVSGV